MQNVITLGQPLLGEKYVAQKRKKEKKKNNTKYSGHSVPQQRPRAAQLTHTRMHSARTNILTTTNYDNQV